MAFGDFLTWQVLGSFAGTVAVVALLTQFLKDIFKRLPTQWLSYIIALAVLVLTTLVLQGVKVPWNEWALIPFNAVVVSLTANGSYSAYERVKNGKPIF